MIDHRSLSYLKEKWAHTGFQKYFQNMSWLFFSRIICMGLAFVTTAFIARTLGPNNFGQLSYAASFISMFSILATLGIDTVLYRELITYPEQKNSYLGSSFALKLFSGSITAVLITFVAIFFVTDPLSQILIYILSSTFIFNAFQVVSYEFQAQVRSKYLAITAVIVTFILSTLRILVVYWGHGVIYLAGILVLESILYGLLYWYFYEQKIGGAIRSWQFDTRITKKILHDSWPLIFTGAFTLIYARIDQVFIKHLIDAHAVGIYSTAVTVAEVWYFIPVIIITTVFPAIINAKKISDQVYYARLKHLSLLLVILAISIALVVTILAPLLITLIYGSQFVEGTIILQIYVWACVGTFLGYLADNYLVAENFKKVIIFKTFIPMVVNVILNILWIPHYGIVGSAYATLISYSLSPLTLLVFSQTRSHIKKIFLHPYAK